MSNEKTIAKAAQQIFDAYNMRQACAPIRNLLTHGNIEDAYQIQLTNTKRWTKERRIVGCKIGLTSLAVQKQLAVNQPDYGMLFADMDIADGQPIAIDRVMQPKVEAEIAFILRSDITEEQLTSADLLAAIDYATAAIEVVDSRIENWDITILDTIADNASAGLFILGQQTCRPHELDMRLCGMVMERAGEVVSTGAGAACLGSPINSALWLARTMVRLGRPLRCKDIILTGALGPMVVAKPGDVFEARIEGLGSVRAAFSSQQGQDK